jgi:hypothetical protein
VASGSPSSRIGRAAGSSSPHCAPTGPDIFGANSPFLFRALTGEKDQFVPPESSIMPFREAKLAAIAGNHVTMIHPSTNDPSVIDLAVNRIVRRGAAGNIADAALVAIELGDFRKMVREFLPNVA